MGLFGNRRSAKQRGTGFTKTEREIVDGYAAAFVSQGASRAEAIEMMVEQMAGAIAEAKADGTYWLPENLGSWVLSGVPAEDPFVNSWVTKLRASLSGKYADGMQDGDFLAYWDQPEVARRMEAAGMSAVRMAMFIDTLETGNYESTEQAADAAAARVKRSHGMYGHPTGSDDLTDLHRPLPFEVHTRVNAYVNIPNSDPAVLREKFAAAGSVNAHYRASLR